MSIKVEWTKAQLKALQDPEVVKALDAMRTEGLNPKTLATLRTKLIATGGVRRQEADRFARAISRTRKWGDESRVFVEETLPGVPS